jgi:hypothetical protein
VGGWEAIFRESAPVPIRHPHYSKQICATVADCLFVLPGERPSPELLFELTAKGLRTSRATANKGVDLLADVEFQFL